MHAVVIEAGELRWIERPDPMPGDTELLVEVRAAGINAADLVQRQGFYPAPPGAPADIPGLELAGDVVAVGTKVSRFTPGDRVMALVGGGGQATRATVDEAHALAVPDHVDWPAAGGFPEAYSTAFDALWSQCQLQMGERVLVTGAAGGVGTAAVQLAAAAGARVVASVRDPARRPAIEELGAAVAIEPDDVALHGPYDVVLELVGAPSLAGALGSLATGARVVVIGIGGGASFELDLRRLMLARARISASTLRARDRTAKAAVADGVARHVLPLLATGRIGVPISATIEMADAAAAYERFAAGGKLGKIVLVT
ncbi:MAG TPA: zinc-binding dehydrogenase [Acidimicrobiales bacterium]|nr:zinc-binding dehydrogenase [Acidimicrobiales bacterium]